MIKPTVGRVVWYHSAPTDNLVGNDGSQPLAAIVARVWSDTCVNLAVFDANGVAHSRTSVLLVQDGHPAPASNYAEWMPYQKGQAAKTEQLESQVATAAPVTERAIEQEIQDKGLAAPRVAPDDIDATIVAEDYHVFPGTTLTVCCLHLRNGFAVTGESACASPANFNAELGQKIARQNAREKIWALEGYALRERLAANPE